MGAEEENTGIHVYLTAGFALSEQKKKALQRVCGEDIAFPFEIVKELPLDPGLAFPEQLCYKATMHFKFSGEFWECINVEHTPWNELTYNKERGRMEVRPQGFLSSEEPFCYIVYCTGVQLRLELYAHLRPTDISTTLQYFAQELGKRMNEEVLRSLPFCETELMWSDRDSAMSNQIWVDVKTPWMQAFREAVGWVYASIVTNSVLS